MNRPREKVDGDDGSIVAKTFEASIPARLGRVDGGVANCPAEVGVAKAEVTVPFERRVLDVVVGVVRAHAWQRHVWRDDELGGLALDEAFAVVLAEAQVPARVEISGNDIFVFGAAG
eukprot:CAMPEP_0197404904 /NCGR_PEP_ID=MMETSP1165-20131217/23578_1 /TAXON_ID=284809 /ORGANISM="Chrysocystis fragilis, Strain CCMP3189" /LENGTH=116 /DNA_ID=CAMNT_0042931197 /DNA_START=46 /DNA_END=394 /DNA_ORIENTATION=+